MFFPDPLLVFERESFGSGWTAFSWNSAILAPDVSPPLMTFKISSTGELEVSSPADESPAAVPKDDIDFFVGFSSLRVQIYPTGGVWILHGQVDPVSDEIFFNDIDTLSFGQVLPLQVGWLAFWIQGPEEALQGLTVDVTYAYEVDAQGSDMDMDVPPELAGAMRNVSIISTIPVTLANAIETPAGKDPIALMS